MISVIASVVLAAANISTRSADAGELMKSQTANQTNGANMPCTRSDFVETGAQQEGFNAGLSGDLHCRLGVANQTVIYRGI